jgi:glucose-6-phosphate isomerase
MIDFKNFRKIELNEEENNIIMNVFGTLVMEKEKGKSGYYKLPMDSLYLIDEAKNYLETESSFLEQIDNIVVVGIGGSSLGTKAIDSLLRHKYKKLKKLYFLENPDPISIKKTFNKIKKEDTIFVLISKSGSTIETTSIFKAIIEEFNIDFTTNDKKRVMVITDENSPL